MRLTPEEIQQIIQEVEYAKLCATRRYLNQLEDECETEYYHGNWGDRD